MNSQTMSSQTMSTQSTEVVLFDVGGILIRLAGVGVWGEMTGVSDEAEIWRRWLECPVVRDYERGHCSADDFARRMIDTHQLPVAHHEFLASFASWPDGLFDGARQVVNDVVGHVRTGCFSNTNDVHWSHPCNQEIHGLFDIHFLSHIMGHVKPDNEAFHHVSAELDCDPGAILFIDDNIINVEAARACGFNAHVAREPDGARRVLSQHGLIR